MAKDEGAAGGNGPARADGPTGETRADTLRAIATSRVAALALLILLAGAVLVLPLLMTRIRAGQPTPLMLYEQDLVLLPLFGIAVLLFRPGVAGWAPMRPARWQLPVAAAALFAVCLWGHWGVFQGIDLSRDEQMAVFDAAIFRAGHLAMPIPPEWRGIAPALNLLFLLPLGDHAAWVSAYLPVHAALRALVATVADPAVTSPLLAVVGLVALAAIARRLWPHSPGSRWTAIACYLLSSQVIITGMTAYAMTAHLALNLIWLWLFLRDDRIGVAGALAVGFLATGLHQPLFHPLFALPFLVPLLWQRRWRRVLAYGLGYAAITGFWMAWPIWMSGYAGPIPAANDVEGIAFTARLARQLALIDPGAVWTMGANLIRFVTWQHLLLLPLMLLGAIGGWRRWPLVAPLAIGIVLPIVVMGLLLPWQGHGWGYRYLHPVLGNACLLAGYGWRRAEAAGIDLSRLMMGASAASLALIPVHGWMTRTMVMTQAVPERRIARLPADVVVIDTAPYSGNLVINAPDLGPGRNRRPIRLDGAMLRPGDIAGLCRGRGGDGGRSLAFADAAWLDGLSIYYTGRHGPAATAHQRQLHRAAEAAGCRIVRG